MACNGQDVWESTQQRLQANFWFFLIFLLAADLGLAVATVVLVPYTEIDWRAYMQEVAGVIVDGEFDYLKLRGDTGPLVYPAGFVYAYALLFQLTDGGSNVLYAQFVYCVLHALCFGTVAFIYYLYCSDQPCDRRRPRLHMACILLLLISRRVMSLFVLRLFNDALQVLLVYLAVASLASNRWILGCLLFSASVSVKMNALLYTPALAVVLCQALGPLRAFAHLVLICGGFQLVVGAPFLWHASSSYLSKAFEFDRVFLHKWSVNGAFLPEETFSDSRLAAALLGTHLFMLLIFGQYRWTIAGSGGLLGLISTRGERSKEWLVGKDWWVWALRYKPRRLQSCHVIHCMFSCNLIGIVFARTLHYQFYLWYFHTLPLLIFTCELPMFLKVALLLAIEIAFNVYPPRHLAALALCLSHLTLLSFLWNLPPKKSRDINSCVSSEESTTDKAS